MQKIMEVTIDLQDEDVIPAAFETLGRMIHQTAVKNGFWDAADRHARVRAEAPHDDVYVIGTKLALIHSEVAEALDVFRLAEFEADALLKDKFMEELADVIIRTLDLALGMGEDSLGEIILEKMTTNTNRPYKHNKRF